MGLFEGLVELVAPTRCGGCDLPGHLFCDDCTRRSSALVLGECCPRCGAPFGALVCTECWRTSFAFEAAVCAGELAGPLARAIVLHKDAGERRLGVLLGGLLASRVRLAWPGWADAVCWVPSSREAVARRGFDHAAAIAAPVADDLSVPALDLLARSGRARDQRGLSRAARTVNSSSGFHVLAPPPPHVVLVDDVLTTGATVDAAASALLAAGAQSVRVAAVARAW